MSSTKEPIGIRFSRLCHERHVPSKLSTQWMVECVENYPRSEREAYYSKRIAEIERDWPFIPMEQYLASIEESKDWDDLFRYRSVYWQDVPSMLADAVKTRSLHTIRQLALHCLFENDKLKEEMLALAPDQRTKKALMYPPRLKEEAYYKQYPFCIKEHGVTDIYHLNIRKHNLVAITLPQDMQPVLLASLMKKGRYANEQHLVRQLKKNYPFMLEHRIFTLGYHLQNDQLVRQPIPECWLTNESMSECNFPDDELIEMGLSGLLAETIHSGCKRKFDGVKNRFGITGYWYLTEWP